MVISEASVIKCLQLSA